MRTIRLLILSALTLPAAATVASAQNVSVNAVITGQVVPGVYGQVVIGNGPPPPVVYAQPVVVQPPPVVVGVPPPAPLYLHVPPGHAKHWRKHCHEYHACNRPVYFVKSPEYEPGFNRERWEREHGHGHGHEDHGHHGDDRGDHDRGDHDRG
ncbi:MAG TPA: hypothetical protein VEU54_07710 [Steroidobacteraceae bacterium]|nr:hypothetical protein [Steroidobacteraceae bacterium]